MELSGSIDIPAEPPSGSVGPRWDLLARPRRIALLGLAVTVLVATFLGVAIPAAVERTLLESRRDVFARVSDDLSDRGLIGAAMNSDAEVMALDDAVHDRLLGAGVIRVKLWDASGTVVYSDAGEFIGATDDQSDDVARALGGTPVIGHPDSDEAGFDRVARSGSVHEYYLPIEGESGEVVAVFEVYEQAESIDAALTSVRWKVWLSISLGLAVVVVFLLGLMGASRKDLDRRRRQAERLVAEMARAQESERERVIGTLHDEIGQPLYRVLYGLEGSSSQVDPESPVAEELGRMTRLVRWMDGALRSELLMLHQGPIAEADLDTLLQRLVEDVRTESSLEIGLTINGHDSLGEGSRAALFRATREAVTNARKHAGASRVDITVTEGSHRVIVDVEDDGSGFGGDVGLGLSTTRDRLEALGGGLKVLAAVDGGTLFRAWVPIDEAGSG